MYSTLEALVLAIVPAVVVYLIARAYYNNQIHIIKKGHKTTEVEQYQVLLLEDRNTGEFTSYVEEIKNKVSSYYVGQSFYYPYGHSFYSPRAQPKKIVKIYTYQQVVVTGGLA